MALHVNTPNSEELVVGILTTAGEGFTARKPSKPNSQLANTAAFGTPYVVRSSFLLRVMVTLHRGQASGMEARACKIREAMYSELMAVEVAEKIKNPFKKCGQPRRWARTTAMMNTECCPFGSEFIV